MAWSLEVVVLSATVVAIETCCHDKIQQGNVEAYSNERTKRKSTENNPGGVRLSFGYCLKWPAHPHSRPSPTGRSIPDPNTHRAGLGFYWLAKARTIHSAPPWIRLHSNGQCTVRLPPNFAIQRQDFESDAASAAPPPHPPWAQLEAQARVTARCPSPRVRIRRHY